ncbi:hypothetical protein MAA8898_00748 [Maliponia aquimaris]|uniref:Uncharacterized protein n=1 Tax=Maliponia aquimaris TaxID=1673631 RepID=A0A238JZM2_9RHOB|nr:hypothetical protein MAA8898_00748 [Maliponia aquimaris]
MGRDGSHRFPDGGKTGALPPPLLRSGPPGGIWTEKKQGRGA